MAVGQTFPLRVGTLNAALWKNTALGHLKKNGQPVVVDTNLHCEDDVREKFIVKYILDSDVDVWALQELFDPEVFFNISALRQKYPYVIPSPVGKGIDGIVEVVRKRYPPLWRTMEGEIPDFCEKWTKAHYKSDETLPNKKLEYDFWSLFFSIMPEEEMAQFFQCIIGFAPFWGSGLFYLSKYPLQDLGFSPFEERYGVERFANKGSHAARLKIPGYATVDLVNVHAQERPDIPKVRAKLDRVKKIQAERLHRHVRQVRPLLSWNNEVIVLGDFNENRRQGPLYQLLTEKGLHDVFGSQPLGDPTYFGRTKISLKKGDVGPNAWLDYIFTTMESSSPIIVPVRDEGGELVSDHAAVIATSHIPRERNHVDIMKSAARRVFSQLSSRAF